MKRIRINGITILLENVTRVVVEENFSGSGEILSLFGDGGDDPLELLVYDAASVQAEIRRILEMPNGGPG